MAHTLCICTFHRQTCLIARNSSQTSTVTQGISTGNKSTPRRFGRSRETNPRIRKPLIKARKTLCLAKSVTAQPKATSSHTHGARVKISMLHGIKSQTHRNAERAWANPSSNNGRRGPPHATWRWILMDSKCGRVGTRARSRHHSSRDNHSTYAP